jgi:hypothetical protein
MPITNIDFSELQSGEDSKGMGLQNLVAAIGRGLGYRIIEPGGTGADQGRDLYFATSPEIIRGLQTHSKVLVSCKDTAKSGKRLKPHDLDAFDLRVKQHQCDGYLLVTTVMPTDDVVKLVHDVANRSNFPATIWQPDDLRDILLNGQEGIFRFTLARFFPQSSRRNDADEHLVNCFLESLDHIEGDDCLSLSLKFIQGLSDPLTIWKCVNKLFEDGSFDIETDLQPHVAAAARLENNELDTAIEESEVLINALESWANSETEWTSFSSYGLSIDRDGDLVIDFESTEFVYTMGTQLETNNSGTIKWSESGFDVKECLNDWEEGRRIDAECDAEMNVYEDQT